MRDVQSLLATVRQRNPRSIGLAISLVENQTAESEEFLDALEKICHEQLFSEVIGITGPPGSGKSTLTDQLIAYYRQQGERVGVLAIDPSSSISGGAVLGDRIRMMRHATDPDVVVRSMATRGQLGGISSATRSTIKILGYAGCRRVIIETVGVGQSELDITYLADTTLLVCAPGLGDDIQAMKAGLLELADIVVVNKTDRPGADALVNMLESVVKRGGVVIRKTCALDGQGVPDLARAIELLQERRGANKPLRQTGFEAEVVSCAMEMLRPIIVTELQKKNRLEGRARKIAKDIVKAICRDDQSGEA